MTITTNSSTVDANKALVRRAIGYNHGALDDDAEIFAPDFVAYMPGQPPMDRVDCSSGQAKGADRALSQLPRDPSLRGSRCELDCFTLLHPSGRLRRGMG